MVTRDWLRSFDFLIQSKTARKKLLLPCRLAIWKLFEKAATKTKQVGVLQNIWDEEFWREASEKFSKTERLFALTGRREEMNKNGEISPSDGERRRVCRIFDEMVAASAKI